MSTTSGISIVFITGAFIGNNCWDDWKSYFENEGYITLAPPWPNKESSPEQLRRRHPDPAIASNRLLGLMEHFTSVIVALPEKPILIGHSTGGLIVQLLLQRGLARAAIVIHSFPPHGVDNFKFAFIKVWWEAMAFFTSSRKTYLISFRRWQYSIAHGMSCEQQKGTYYDHATPESKLLIRDSFKCKAKINFKSPHTPLLIISGSLDKMIPASVNYSNYKKYKVSNSITDYREFKGRNHLVFGQSTSMEEAAFVLYWLRRLNKLELK